MEGRINAVAEKTAKLTEKPPVFYVFDTSDPTKPWTAGAGSFIDALISIAGGENIAGSESGDWVQFSLENLVAANPEIIIVDTSMGATKSGVINLTGWKDMDAVKNGRVYEVDGELTSRPGPRIVEGLEILAKDIHPELTW